MSFFVRNVKSKTQKLNLKRKTVETTNVSINKNKTNGLKKSKHDLSEEIPSDTDDELMYDELILVC
jgi:hypothetical protein